MKIKRHYVQTVISGTVGLLLGLVALKLINLEQPATSSTTTTTVTTSAESIETQETPTKGENLEQIIREITVQIVGKYDLGSGIIIEKKGQIYTVLTNAHVVREQEEYSIKTPDGKLYQGKTLSNPNLDNYDLALVEFESVDREYQVAQIGDSDQLTEGDKVVAAGFPLMSHSTGFKFSEGLISLIPEKALEEGYQIGSTNEIEKGMSGGPLLNIQGELIGVNGIHAYPLWEDAYLYQDGSQPCSPLQEIMNRSSWAIPINTFLKLVPEYSQNQVKASLNHNQPLKEKQSQIKQEAEQAKKCQPQ